MSLIEFVSVCVISFGIGFFAAATLYEKHIFIIMVILGVSCLLPPTHKILTTPKDKDVEQGKAHYVETQHISVQDNDTIRYSTYEIKWKEE